MTAVTHAYDQDFHGWLNDHVQLIRDCDFARLDREHLAEELEAMPLSTRLAPDEMAAIAQAARRHLEPGSRVRLFGSRLDPCRRGGDIDLLIESPRLLSPEEEVEQRNRFVAHLYRLIGERQIDVLMVPLNAQDDRPVVDAARREGVLLTEVPG